MKALKEKVKDKLFKQDQSLQMVHMLCKPKPHYDEMKKIAIHYKNPLYLTRAKQVQPALYNGPEIIKTHHVPAIVHDSEDTLEIANTNRKKMNEKMKDLIFCISYPFHQFIIMSNINNNMQTQTSNTLHNAIMEAGSKDHPPMLAPGNYIQWKSRIKRYIDTKPNRELIHFCLTNPPYELGWKDKPILDSEGNSTTTTQHVFETFKNVTEEIRDQLNAEAEAVQIILTGIDNDIYSTVDACPNACETWKAIERLKQGESINVQDLETNLFWEFRKFMSLDGESIESYYLSRANQDNSPRIYKNVGYETQRSGTVAGARETKPKRAKDAAYHREKMLLCKQEEAGIQLNAEQADWKDNTGDESDDQELEAHYMYMAKLQQVSPDAVDSRPIFDTEPEQKVQNDDHYDVFAIECQHPEQSKSAHNTYLLEQDVQNVSIESMDMNYNSEQIDQNDEEVDLAKERELLASLIAKLKCEIDESKNSNTLLETSNKVLVKKLKSEIADFKNKNKSLTEANNKLSERKSRIKRYIDTKPNRELIHYYLENPPYELGWNDKPVLDSEGNPTTATARVFETYKNVTQEIRDQLNAEDEAVQIILTGIDNDIYSTVDACPNACKMWKAIDRLKQGESINVQDLETNLFWEFGKFTSLDGESLESYYSRNREKEIVNSPQPIYDQEPSMVDDDDETSKEKEIDKLMALISLSFKKIYKPTNNNL
nr:hypothetical protein [Tanacetum cinerariifolium]